VSSLKVLLVDDEEELVSALAERLGYRGIDTQYALNGPDALRMIREERIDVVVLDLKLPGMSGVEVHEAIKRELPDLPVILITGHGAPPEQLGLPPGEDYVFLEKPVALDVFIERIKEVTKTQGDR
jgi:DNA-binding NtrC family response regulator